MNGDVKSDIATLAFKNGEQIEDFHNRIIRLQQEILLSGEIVSPTRLLLQYINALSNSDKLRSFIAPKMTYLTTFLDNNGKYSVYTEGDIHGIYCYLEIIGSPTPLTTSGQRFHHFGPSFSATTMHQLSSQLFQLSEWDRRVFVNDVEELDTKLMHASSVVQSFSHQR